MKDYVMRGVSLDGETDRLLAVLARRHEGNKSLTIRELIRQAASSARPGSQPVTNDRGFISRRPGEME